MIPRAKIDPATLPAKKNHPELTREEWFELAVDALGSYFEAAALTLPPVKVSCSWPGGGSPRKRIGECWACANSAAGINEIFISPVIAEPVTVLATLVHELCHAVDDCKHGHKGPFGRMARALGLEGKLTATHAGPALAANLQELADILGPYPHSVLRLRAGKQKQQAGQVKVVCQECAFVFRISRKVASEGLSALVCPRCQNEELVCT